LFLAGLVGLPLFNLLAKAGWQPQVVATGETSYTWSYLRFGVTLYESITLYSREYYWSGLLAAGASSIALLAAIVLRLLTRSYGSFVIVSAAMFGIVVIPGPIVGSWVIGLLNRPYPLWLGQLYDNTLAAPILAQQFRLLPLAWLLTTTIVASISPRTWQQAQLDGLHWTARLRWVVLPQTWASWIMAALLLVVTSIGELSCSILVLPPGVTTLSMRLFEMLHFGMRHQDSGLCLILVLVGWLVAGIGWKTLSDR
jgi:iron(III) transport system permease protein